MLEDLDIDFEVPMHLIYHYYFAGSIAIFLNFLVVYLILFHSGRLDNFRFYLLAFQISCIISDFNITFLMQPVTLFPLRAGYCNGILSKTFSVSSHVLMTNFTFLLSEQIEFLSICFLRKHKAIMSLQSFSKPSNSIFSIQYILCVSYAAFITLAFFISDISHQEQMREIEKDYPYYLPKFQALREFAYYTLNARLLFFLAMVAAGTVKTTVLVTFLVARMYRTLKQNSSRMSSNTMARHKAALKGLIMQFLTTPLSFLPAFFAVLLVLFPTPYNEKISWLNLMIGTTHSIVNSIVVLTTYPEFRKVLLFWKKDMRKLSVRIAPVKPSGS